MGRFKAVAKKHSRKMFRSHIL